MFFCTYIITEIFFISKEIIVAQYIFFIQILINDYEKIQKNTLIDSKVFGIQGSKVTVCVEDMVCMRSGYF